ncbi:MAG: DUF4783 domain-containing protein [Bacteroidales bacterium]
MNYHAKIVPIVILIGFIMLTGTRINEDEIPGDIAIAFKVGTAKELSRFFNENLELSVLENDDIYSRSQAERIMDDFFKEYTPKNFEFIHEGGKQDAKYAIGKLETFNGTFRVYLLLKKEKEKLLIHQLRIEKENE